MNQTVKKVELKYRSEKDQKVRVEYARPIDVQRQYAAALKWLAEGRRLAGVGFSRGEPYNTGIGIVEWVNQTVKKVELPQRE